VLITSLLLIWPEFGFGYKPYNSDERYTWWSWYGWEFDVNMANIKNEEEYY